MLGGRRKHPTGPTAYGYKKKKNARRGRASRLKKKEAIEGVSPLHPSLVGDGTAHFIGQRLSKTFATKNYCSRKHLVEVVSFHLGDSVEER